MSYLEHIKNNNHYEANRFVILLWMMNSWDGQILRLHNNCNLITMYFLVDNESLRFNPEINAPEQRTRALVPVLGQLHREGVIDAWVGETYALTEKSWNIHFLNGFVKRFFNGCPGISEFCKRLTKEFRIINYKTY